MTAGQERYRGNVREPISIADRQSPFDALNTVEVERIAAEIDEAMSRERIPFGRVSVSPTNTSRIEFVSPATQNRRERRKKEREKSPLDILGRKTRSVMSKIAEATQPDLDSEAQEVGDNTLLESSVGVTDEWLEWEVDAFLGELFKSGTPEPIIDEPRPNDPEVQTYNSILGVNSNNSARVSGAYSFKGDPARKIQDEDRDDTAAPRRNKLLAGQASRMAKDMRKRAASAARRAGGYFGQPGESGKIFVVDGEGQVADVKPRILPLHTLRERVVTTAASIASMVAASNVPVPHLTGADVARPSQRPPAIEAAAFPHNEIEGSLSPLGRSQAEIVNKSKEEQAANKLSFLPAEMPPFPAEFEAKKGDLLDKLRSNPENVTIYRSAGEITGIHWTIFAGIHEREGSMGSNVSLASGRKIGDWEPDIHESECEGKYAPGKPIILSRDENGKAKCGFKSVLDSAIYAGNHLKEKAKKRGVDLTTFEGLVNVLSDFNGGGNRNSAWPSDKFGPEKFRGESDPYVMNFWGEKWTGMNIHFCKDYVKSPDGCAVDGRPGVLTTARLFATYPESETLGIPKTNEIIYPPNLGKPNELGYYKMPESEKGIWRFLRLEDEFSERGKGSANTCEAQRYGKKELIGVLYTAIMQFSKLYPGTRVVIADLNADGHGSHGRTTHIDADDLDGGIDVDLYLENGGLDTTNKKTFNVEQAVALNTFLMKTGMVDMIFYNDEETQRRVAEVAKNDSLPGKIIPLELHDKHPHLRIKGNGGPEHIPSC